MPETPIKWRKSTFSGATDCVEVARLADDVIGVRHSKRPGDDTVTFTPAEIDAFLKGVRAGEFDEYAI